MSDYLSSYALKVQYGDGRDTIFLSPALQAYMFKCIRLRHSCWFLVKHPVNIKHLTVVTS